MLNQREFTVLSSHVFFYFKLSGQFLHPESLKYYSMCQLLQFQFHADFRFWFAEISLIIQSCDVMCDVFFFLLLLQRDS